MKLGREIIIFSSVLLLAVLVESATKDVKAPAKSKAFQGKNFCYNTRVVHWHCSNFFILTGFELVLSQLN